MRKFLASLIALPVLLLPFLAVGGFSQTSAKTYLRLHSDNPWSTMALAALGETDIPTAHLRTINATSAIEYAAPILALTALNENSRTFGSHDYVAALKAFYHNGQIGEPNLLNDDIFGILALVAAGEPLNDEIITTTKNFLLTQQKSNGGWGFAVSGSSDTNMTAAAILALLAAGTPKNDIHLQAALAYLKSAQNEDGGFPYDPQSQFDRSSDTASTAWVVWALNALGINPASLSKPGGHPMAFLESHQTASGYFEYQQGTREDGFTPITTSYAVIALTGKFLPVNTAPVSDQPAAETFTFRIEGSRGTICQGRVAGPTALDIVRNGSLLCDYTYVIEQTSLGPYLSQINDDKAQGLIGWIYLVNNLAPNIGAADYILQPGDNVLWYYGEFGRPPGASSAVGLNVVIEKGEVQGEQTIIFTVSPTTLDFGSLKPGEAASRELKLSNLGTETLKVESAVNGDEVFTNHLFISGVVWQNFQTRLSSNEEQAQTVQLALPANFAGSAGGKTGRLIFWASPQ